MDLTLSGKTLLITGASQGLGVAIAREAAQRGASALALVARTAERGEAVAAELRDEGCEARFFAADLALPDEPVRVFGEVLGWAGQLDGLVNSAAATTRASMIDGTAEDWEALFAVNARAPYFLMQGFIRHCLAQGGGGAIVNIQSINVHCGAPDLAIYSATKAALANMTKNAARAHLAERIRVNGINMGWTDTDGENRMQAETLGKGAGWRAAAAAGMPLGRLLAPEEIARLCVYLLSDYSAPQTGACIDLEQRVIGVP